MYKQPYMEKQSGRICFTSNIDYVKMTPIYDKGEISVELYTNKRQLGAGFMACAEISFEGKIINKVSVM